MSKAIIVIDLPNGTKVEDFSPDVRLRLTTMDLTYKYFEDEVKLKEMPNEKPLPTKPLQNEHETGWTKGWNSCIKEILK